MNFIEYLSEEIERTGHTIKRDVTSFTVESLNLKIEAEISERNEHNVNGQHSVVHNINIIATNEQLFPEGIWDCLAGVGENDEQAFGNAAQVWTEGVFLTIHEILVPTQTKAFQVPRFDMLTRNQDTGEEFGWIIVSWGISNRRRVCWTH